MTQNCLSCAHYFKCADPNKQARGREYSCHAWTGIDFSSSGLSLEATNEYKSKQIASTLIEPSAIDETEAFAAELGLEKMWDEVLNSKSPVPPDLVVDDRDFKEFGNFFDFCMAKDGLTAGTPFPRQLWLIANLLGDACGNPKCTDPKWFDVNNIPVGLKNIYDLLEMVTFYQNGVCPKCKQTRAQQIRKKIVRRPNEGYACLTGDTLVQTAHGLVRLDSMGDRLGVRVNSGYAHDVAYQFLPKGLKSTYRVTTAKGYSVRGTYDHEVQVLNIKTLDLEWKDLGKLTETDLLCISLNETKVRRKLKLSLPDNPSIDHKVKKLRKPRYMTVELARLLGLLLSDGSVGVDGFTFVNADTKLHKIVRDLTLKEFGVVATTKLFQEKGSTSHVNGVAFTRTKDVHATTLYSSTLGQWLNYLGVKFGSKNLEIPWAILEADCEAKAAFLASFVEGDGSVRTERVSFYSSSVKALGQIQVILQSWGILSGQQLRENDGSNALNVCGNYGNALYARLRPYMVSKRKKTYVEARATGTDVMGIPVSGIMACLGARRVHPSKHVYLNDDGKPVNCVVNSNGFHHQRKTLPYSKVTPPLLSNLAKVSPCLSGKIKALAEAGYYFDRVSSVDYVGRETVYDINVRKSHRFTANGIVVHNCVGQRAGKSTTLSMLSSYILHKYLKLQNPTAVFGLFKGSILTASFVALTFGRAQNLLWNPIQNMLMNSEWFCIAEGSQVTLADGSTQSIETIVPGTEVRTLEGTSVVDKVFDNGYQECFDVETDGTHLIGTESHKVRCVVDGELVWKTIGELTEDDLVVLDEDTDA